MTVFLRLSLAHLVLFVFFQIHKTCAQTNALPFYSRVVAEGPLAPLSPPLADVNRFFVLASQ